MNQGMWLLRHALYTLGESFLHSLYQDGRDGLVRGTNRDAVHLHIVSIKYPFL